MGVSLRMIPVPDEDDFQKWKKQQASGLVQRGNINLTNRPRVKNPDGSVSTVRSISINEDGREVLIPTVSDDGRVLSNDDAVALYHQTGKHLGTFRDAESATRYAHQLHNDQAATLTKPETHDDADFQAWKAKQPPPRDFHEEYRKGLLGPRMQRENANERDAADAEPSYFERFATHLLNTAQGIPGVERIEAGFASGPRENKMGVASPGLTYQQSLAALRGNTEQIPTALRIGEHVVGGLPVAAALPVGQSKTIWQAAKSGAKVGAGLGASDAALSADEMPVSERAGRTVAGGVVGGTVGGVVGGGARAVDKGRELVRTYQRVKNAPALGKTSLATDQKINDATRWNYGAADLEGELNGGTSPAIQQAFENPRIKKYVDLIRDGEEGSPTSDADVAREAYKLMSKARRGHQRFMDINGYDADRDREVTKLGLAMKRLKDATAAGSEKPPITLDIAGETTTRPLDMGNGGPPGTRDLLRQRAEATASSLSPRQPTSSVSRSIDEVLAPNARPNQVEITRSPMRVQAAPAEAVPPLMPSFPGAVETKARMEGGREAFREGTENARRIMAGRPVAAKKLDRQSPEAIAQWAASLSPDLAADATTGALGAAKNATKLFPSWTPNQTMWSALTGLTRPATKLNRLGPFLDQLDQAAGRMPQRPANIDALLRYLGIANAPFANP